LTSHSTRRTRSKHDWRYLIGGPNPFSPPCPINELRSQGGLALDEDDPGRRRRRGKSASGELDGPINIPKVAIFEHIKEEDRPDDEFEPVPVDEPHVEWDSTGDLEERWEAILEDLFTGFEDDEDEAVFEEVKDNLLWSEGEVIWEGSDFDQVFSDSGEFHDFELLTRKEKRAFLRDRLRTQQAVGTAESGDVDIDIGLKGAVGEKKARPLKKPKKNTPPPKTSPGPLVSFETETEHRPHELDMGLAPSKGKRRKGRR
jgi:hypothetical protein